MPFCPVLFLDTNEKSPALSSFLPSSHVFISPEVSLLQTEHRSYLSFSLYERCSRPLTAFVALGKTHTSMPVSFLYWWPQHCIQHSRCGHTSTKQRRRITSLELPCWTWFFSHSPRYSWLSGQWVHTALLYWKMLNCPDKYNAAWQTHQLWINLRWCMSESPVRFLHSE